MRVGIAVDSTSYLPLYIAAARTWKQQGIDAQLLAFRGDAEVSQALAGGSVDIVCGSTNGLINLIKAEPDITGFYAGFHLAGFAWYAAPGIRTWADVKGKAMGRLDLRFDDRRAHALFAPSPRPPTGEGRAVDPGRGVGDPARSAALGANRGRDALRTGDVASAGGRLHADRDAVQGHRAGMARAHLLREAVVPRASTAKHDRGAARVRRGDPARAGRPRLRKRCPHRSSQVHARYTPAYANRAYDDVVPTFDERGSLPERSMPSFWEILVRNGDVTAPLPEATFLDRRFIATYSSWAPPA